MDFDLDLEATLNSETRTPGTSENLAVGTYCLCNTFEISSTEIDKKPS